MDSALACCTSARFCRNNSAVLTLTIRTRTPWFCAQTERERLDCASRQGYASRMSLVVEESVPDQLGHFGPYGGRFVPETLMHPLQELEDEYVRSQNDPAFQREFEYYLKDFCG